MHLHFDFRQLGGSIEEIEEESRVGQGRPGRLWSAWEMRAAVPGPVWGRAEQSGRRWSEERTCRLQGAILSATSRPSNRA